MDYEAKIALLTNEIARLNKMIEELREANRKLEIDLE